jgi:heme exporter protein D
MKLTENQIDNLYKFTRQHYVEYYDVQTELVDHLANDIEQIWEENPNISFEEARDKSFKKFGIFGFMDVVQAKEWQMTKSYIKLVFKFVKQWFQLPKIVLTFILYFTFFKLQEFKLGYTIYISIFISVLLFQLVFMIVNGKKLKQKQKRTGKKWLLENVIFVNGISNILVLMIWFWDFPFDNMQEFLAMGNFTKILSAFLITFLIIVGFITLIVIPKKAEELLQETYPNYQIS